MTIHRIGYQYRCPECRNEVRVYSEASGSDVTLFDEGWVRITGKVVRCMHLLCPVSLARCPATRPYAEVAKEAKEAMP